MQRFKSTNLAVERTKVDTCVHRGLKMSLATRARAFDSKDQLYYAAWVTVQAHWKRAKRCHANHQKKDRCDSENLPGQRG